MLDGLLDSAHHHTAVKTTIFPNTLQTIAISSPEIRAATMISLIKSAPSLAAIALLVQPSSAAFLRVLPTIVGGMSGLGTLIGHIGDPQGSVVPSMDNTVDYETLGSVQRVSPGDATLPVPNQLAWQICRGMSHLCLFHFPNSCPPSPALGHPILRGRRLASNHLT